MIYQPSPQAKMSTAFPTATAIPVQAVPTIQMQHPASYLQNATAYHVASSGAPVDTMSKGIVMVPAPVPTAPAGAHAHHSHAIVAGTTDAGSQQQQRAFEQFYFSQQQMMGQQQHHPQHRAVGKM